MKKRIFALLSCGLLFGSAFTANASQTLTEDGSVNVPLTAVIESKYSVSLPASLTLTAGTEEEDGIPFTGTVTVGVKANLNPGKAVVVVPTNGTLEGGALTDESKAAGESAADRVTTEMLNALSGDYETDITIKGTANPDRTATVKAASKHIRWVNGSISTLAKCERHVSNTAYAETEVALSTKLSDADTYTGNLQFTFKLADRN